DEAYINPEGLLLLQGYGSYRTYFKDAIDTLRIDWNVFRVGTHKAFVEPYTRMDMSEEAREDLSRLTGQLWAMYQADVVAARGLEDDAISDFTDRLLAHVAAAGGDMARAAVDHGLVDGTLTHEAIRDRFVDVVGEDAEMPDAYAAVDMYEYLRHVRLLEPLALGAKNVAVIIASGDITVGSPPPGMIGSESTTELLRRALNDESVAAVVLRIDSPGGSTFASDVISSAVQELQEAGKPVVASMGSVAASGGYWIATSADAIYASPSTITGSIGIFGMFPTFQRSLDALGLNVDGVGSTRWADAFRVDREMPEHVRELFQLIIADGYDDFLTRVAHYRGMEKETVDSIGQGRVWTGVDALEKGLVDALGNLEDAVAAAAGLAGLDEGDYAVQFIRQELTPTEQFLIDLMSVGRAFGVDPGSLATRPSGLTKLAARVESALEPLMRFNDPKGVYSHCLCEPE
ncbi:MAG TPA: signal peptide peptidase SppA, partial [Woeseiaceae bacterium]|nr:signal peptide peptidase SppA [Woeseiaceae bacterium]